MVEIHAMLQEIKASWALLLGIGFIMVGNGLQGTLLGVRASLEGFERIDHWCGDVVLLFGYVGGQYY